MNKGIFILFTTLFVTYPATDKVRERDEIRNASAYSFEKYNIGRHLEDDTITRKVKFVMANDTTLDTNAIKINARNELMQLSKKTNLNLDRERAAQLTLNSRGVQAFKDNLNTKE